MTPPKLELSPVDFSSIERAASAARSSGQTQWVGIVRSLDGLNTLGCYASCASDDRFLWERVESETRLVAWGRADEIESAGGERFRDVGAWAKGVASRLHWVGRVWPDSAPIFVGGFGFEEDGASAAEWKGFPSARFILPECLAIERGGETALAVLVRVEPGSEAPLVASTLGSRFWEAHSIAGRGGDIHGLHAEGPEGSDSALAAAMSPDSWLAGPEYRVRSDRAHGVFRTQVRRALEAIAAGDLEKAVLARSLRVDHDGSFDVPGFLGRLAEIYPSCTIVAMGRGDDTFLAATPESLIRLQGDRVDTAALAGSAPRGRSPNEDEKLAIDLESSPKEQAEHAHVVSALRDALGPRCESLEVPDRPRLRRLFGIQHLETPIQGRLRTREAGASASHGHPLLDLVSLLHPTPAVGGAPKNRAWAWLRRNEGLDRGWYASPIGWLDAVGGGDICVALRSALIHSPVPHRDEARPTRGSHAWLFAGAGIVDGSQPEQELVETRVKLRALLAPLTEI